MALALRRPDRQIWEEELGDFIPARMFDFHCHLQNGPEVEREAGRSIFQIPGVHGASRNEEFNRIVFPGKRMSYLAFGWPAGGSDLHKQNAFLAGQVKKRKNFRMLLLVSPEMPADYLAGQLDETGAAGFKPYKCFSRTDPENSAVTDYLPAEQLEIADRRRLIITLHLSRKKGIADKNNFNELLELSGRHAGIVWNLAHCGRSFIPEFIEAGSNIFRELKARKVYFDISAVTDSEVIFILIKEMGAARILYGSDNPVGLERGKCVGFGYDWAFLTEGRINFSELQEAPGAVEPTFIVYEQLRALKRACRRAGLSRRDVEGIFYDNAANILPRAGERNTDEN